MCLIAFAWGTNERYPFAIAANRDEYFERPTASLAQWVSPSGVTVVSGRDLREGGIWMGFSPHGRFAMLTNVRDLQAPQPSQPISRGSLAMAWLESDLSVHSWAKQLEPQRYQGFNLIVGDWPSKTAHYLTNQVLHEGKFKSFTPQSLIESAQSATELIVNDMPYGAVYGLSNAALDTPWPKTVQLKNTLRSSLKLSDPSEVIALNLQTLSQNHKPPDHDLPNTGVSIERERALASPFVRYPESQPSYGTRSSLVAIYQAKQGLHITEVTHGATATDHPQISNVALQWH